METQSLYTVIVADDEDELREALCRMIPWEKLGFCLVGSAQNGLEALELIEQVEPDLLLTDIRMPFISGIELARQAREIRPYMHIAFLSGYDDFEYAKQAIQYNIISYMLKPVTLDGISMELTRIREKIDSQFRAFQEKSQQQADRDNFLMQMLLDGYTRELTESETQALVETGVQCGLLRGEEDRPQMQVLVVRLMDADGTACTRPEHVHAVNMILEKYLRYASVFSCGKVLSVLSGNPSDFEEYLHILTSELVQVAERVLQKKCAVGVSKPVFALNHLHAAYREAFDALSYGRTKDSGVAYISDIRQAAPEDAGNLSELVEQVKAQLRDGNAEQMKKTLEQFVAAGSIESVGRGWANMAVLQLVSGVCQTIYQSAGSEAVSALQNDTQEIPLMFQYKTQAELYASLESFCLKAMDYSKIQRKKGRSDLCRQALDAIDRNYRDESLSLVSLSNLLHISPNHLSMCLKKDTGETFINILIRKRMEVAKQMLLNSDRKILDIARECGYSDQHYFSYCFKKYCGTSPLTMRRSAAEKGGTV